MSLLKWRTRLKNLNEFTSITNHIGLDKDNGSVHCLPQEEQQQNSAFVNGFQFQANNNTADNCPDQNSNAGQHNNLWDNSSANVSDSKHTPATIVVCKLMWQHLSCVQNIKKLLLAQWMQKTQWFCQTVAEFAPLRSKTSTIWWKMWFMQCLVNWRC